MFYDKYYPFYAIYANPALCRGEKIHEEEFLRMKSYFPEIARKIQEITEEQCDQLDYEGSRLYDEHPDKFMLYHLSQKIREQAEKEFQLEEKKNLSGENMNDLIQVILYQEILRRRCKRKRCRGWF